MDVPRIAVLHDLARSKISYKQTFIGVAWVVLRPLMSMGAFTLFFGKLAKLPSDGLPYRVLYFAALAAVDPFFDGVVEDHGNRGWKVEVCSRRCIFRG
jgi:ABC-type polysaccharide/polyol phosphate export permease